MITGNYTVLERDSQGTLRNVHQVLKQIREGKIDPPIRLSAIRPGFADLEAICTKAIAKDPEKRYGSVDEMIIDLRAWAAGNPVKAYRDTVSGTARFKYDFHHWKRQNTGLWNRSVTAALAVFAVGGGTGAYLVNVNAKAGKAAVIAERSLSTLTTEVNEELAKYIGGYEVQHLKDLPVERLDLLVAGGNFDVSFRTFLKKTLEELRTKVLQEADVLSYRGYGVVADIYREATELEKRLTDIESLFEARVKNRELVRAELEDFRQEFTPIRDFLGNDFEALMSDAPQGRIDKALARYLPAFRDVAHQEGQERLFFPECSQDMPDFLQRIEAAERSRDEVQEIKAGVATLLSYKVLNLQRTASTGFAPHVKQFVPVCSRYLEDARRLRGGDPSVCDLILWERVATELNDPRADELRSKINAITELALQQDGSVQHLHVSSQDLGMLAGGLMEKHRHADALKLFEKILVVRSSGGQSEAAALPSRYLGQFGRGVCSINLATAAVRETRPDDSKKHLIDAADALSSAKELLSSLPDNSADKRAKLGIIYLCIAKTHVMNWVISKDPVQVAEMQAAHANAQGLIDGPRLFQIIAENIFDTDAHEAAEVEFSKAIDAAPYAANQIRPKRALCYALMVKESKMLSDVEAVLADAEIETQGFRVYPQDLIFCAKALGTYILMHDMNPELYSMSESKRREYLERMKEVFLEVERLCASGAPCTEAVLDLNSELYQPLKDSDPEFWGWWRWSTLSHLPSTSRN